MVGKLHESPVRQRKPKEGERAAVVVEVIPDVFTDLWVRYDDGSWRCVDLTLLAQSEPFQALQNPRVFQQARMSRNRLAVEWPGGVRLGVKQLDGMPHELNAENVYVRAASDTAYGWFRPLMVSVPRWLERRHWSCTSAA